MTMKKKTVQTVKRMTLRLTLDTHARLARLAKTYRRSLHAQATGMLEGAARLLDIMHDPKKRRLFRKSVPSKPSDRNYHPLGVMMDYIFSMDSPKRR